MPDDLMGGVPYAPPNSEHQSHRSTQAFTEAMPASPSIPFAREVEDIEAAAAAAAQRDAQPTNSLKVVRLQTPGILGRVANRIRKLFVASDSDTEYRSVRDRPPTPHPVARIGSDCEERTVVSVYNRISRRFHSVISEEERGLLLMTSGPTIEDLEVNKDGPVSKIMRQEHNKALQPDSSIPPLHLPPPILRIPGHDPRILPTAQVGAGLRQQQLAESLSMPGCADDFRENRGFRSQKLDSDEETLTNTGGGLIRPQLLYASGALGQ